MLCIKNINGKIIRVKDKRAHKLCASGEYSYCPKWEYKDQKKKEKK